VTVDGVQARGAFLVKYLDCQDGRTGAWRLFLVTRHPSRLARRIVIGAKKTEGKIKHAHHAREYSINENARKWIGGKSVLK